MGRLKGNVEKKCSVCRVIYKEQDRVRVLGGRETCTYDRTIGCRSRNAIYGIFCQVCRCVVYLGETGGVLYQRIQNYLSSIRCGRNEMEVVARLTGRVTNDQMPNL